MLQSYKYEYKGALLSSLPVGPNDVIELNNISDFSYDATIFNVTITVLLENQEQLQEIKFYDKFYSPHNVKLKKVIIQFSPERKYDTINYIQWRK